MEKQRHAKAGERRTGQILPTRQWLNARLCSAEDRVSLEISGQGRRIAALEAPPLPEAPGLFHLGTDLAAEVESLNAGIGRITLHDGGTGSPADPGLTERLDSR